MEVAGGGGLILTIESGGGWGGAGGGGVGIFCPVVRLSHEEFNSVPERTSGMKNENKGLRITYFINFLASSLITQIFMKPFKKRQTHRYDDRPCDDHVILSLSYMVY